jgi:hypothetical protein
MTGCLLERDRVWRGYRILELGTFPGWLGRCSSSDYKIVHREGWVESGAMSDSSQPLRTSDEIH